MQRFWLVVGAVAAAAGCADNADGGPMGPPIGSTPSTPVDMDMDPATATDPDVADMDEPGLPAPVDEEPAEPMEPIQTPDPIPADAVRAFRCQYTNGFNGTAGCRDYGEGTAQADAEADCVGQVHTDDDSVVMSEGACELEEAHGYCSDDANVRDFAYAGGCDPASMDSGAWACSSAELGGAGLVAGGVWSCLLADSEPPTGDPEPDPEPEEPTVPPEEPTNIFVCDLSDTGWGCSGGDTSSYLCDTCIELPAASGWTAAAALETCNGLAGSNGQGDLEAALSENMTGCGDSGETLACDNAIITGDAVSTGLLTCAAIPGGSSEPCEPDTTGILTCRYTDGFSGNPACVDYPEALGWTTETAQAHCESQNGSDFEMQSDSCLAVEGAGQADRCQVNDGDGTGWDYYAYGTPANICSGILGGSAASGPFCSGY